MARSRIKVPKEIQPLVQEALGLGCSLERTKKSHLKLTLPCGQKVYTSGSPGDYRAVQNLRAQLRQYGLQI
jgi:hypothetical protein